jgi:serine/threonine protein kinase
MNTTNICRVEDDCESFPFNSCGTAAYVAPEALVMNKKVDSSVDVYAFGIMMWEILVGRAPYSNMKQQKIVEEVSNPRLLASTLLHNSPPDPPTVWRLPSCHDMTHNRRIHWYFLDAGGQRHAAHLPLQHPTSLHELGG